MRKPVLLYIHGGGWFRGSKGAYALQLLPWLAKGWTVVSVNYRLSGSAKAPAALEDAHCALQWIHQNADRFGFDRSAVVVAGQSAGAHLALLTGLTTRDTALSESCPGPIPAPAAIVSLVGFADLLPLVEASKPFQPALDWLGSSASSDPARVKAMSPLHRLEPGAPPIISVHGDADSIHPYEPVRVLHARLSSAGVPNQLVTLPGHNGTEFTPAQIEDIYRQVFAFLERSGIPTADLAARHTPPQR